ncbi:MAG: universal stress protein [Ginsengibacter sp.]
MIKQILVPTDFSLCAEKAINFAVQSAKFLPVQIKLYHAFDLRGDIYTDYMGVTKEYNQSLYNDVVNKLNEIKSNIARADGINVDVLITKNSFQKAIKDVVKTNDIDLVIMGTVGASQIKKILFGSNTSFVIGNSKVPVLAIPSEYEWKKPNSLLFATNHFEDHTHKLDFLFEIANLFVAKINAIIFTDEKKDSAGTAMLHTHESPEYEKLIRKKYNKSTFTATHMVGRDFIASMQDYVDKNKVDILAMFTHKRKFLEKIFNPSITRKMSYYTKIPLLAIP